MVIEDKIYGRFEITLPIAIELIETDAFKRLKGVCQFGIPDKYYYRTGYSRFEHSIGVYIFLNKFGAAEDEQVAGLLHDISHTAFSHLIDWVLGGDTKQENYQDNIHLSVLQQPEIALILLKYGFTPEQMADYHSFGLLEREIPDLCADRIDYSLRQMDKTTIERSLASLIVHNDEFIFSEKETALVFADNFIKLQTEDWAGYEACTRYEIFSDLLRTAIKNNDLVFEDMEKTDDHVTNKLIKTGKTEYLKVLKLLENKDLSFLPRSERPGVRKFRYVDPKILNGNTTVRLSTINGEFNNFLEEARAINAQGVKPGVFNV